jgi:SAM-dependent methyltransferase
MAAMRHIASGRAPLVAGYVPPPRRGARLLDVGGAPGTYATAFAAAGWEVTVFDLPATLEAVARDLEARGVDRVGGDMTVGLPDGPWDAVYLGNVLHLFDRETARAIVARAAGVLGPGGRLAIQEMMLGRAPQAAAFAVMMLVSTAAGDTYAEEDYRRWMREAGVAPQSIVDLDGREHQLLIGRRDG